mgnify:CR=1 FL=1
MRISSPGPMFGIGGSLLVCGGRQPVWREYSEARTPLPRRSAQGCARVARLARGVGHPAPDVDHESATETTSSSSSGCLASGQHRCDISPLRSHTWDEKGKPCRYRARGAQRFSGRRSNDEANPPALHSMEPAIAKIPGAKYVLIPQSEKTHGHYTHLRAAIWKPYFIEFLKTLPPVE